MQTIQHEHFYQSSHRNTDFSAYKRKLLFTCIVHSDSNSLFLQFPTLIHSFWNIGFGHIKRNGLLLDSLID